MQLNSTVTRNVNFKNLPIIEKKGFRLGDRIDVSPVFGKKKSFDAHWTKLSIISDSGPTDSTLKTVILPSFDLDPFYLELELIKSENSAKEDDGRFRLKSFNHVPFRLNGSYSYESLIERGDKIQIGHNSIYFYSKAEDENKNEVFDNIYNEKLIKSDLNILLEGKTGTGKTYKAKKIHEESGRVGKFVHLNLTSYSENLIESEIFGHLKGSFTGALINKRGAIQEANMGTLFLDEIDSLPLDIQTKLLLFLDSKVFRAVGSTQDQAVDVRLIFASGKDLRQLVSDKRMREDFYYRIASGKIIHLNSLNSEPLLIKKYCEEFAHKFDILISDKLVDYYMTLEWPGNIRQLFGHLRKKMTLSYSRKLDLDDMDKELIKENIIIDNMVNREKILPWDELKDVYTLKVLELFNYDKLKTSSALGISVRHLNRVLKELNYEPKR